MTDIPIVEALGAVQTMTITNLNSLARSVTAGWRSAAIDNTSDLFMDIHIQFKLAAVNTAPANGKTFYLFASGLLDDSGSDYATTGAASGGAPDGSEGTLTFPAVDASPVNLPQIGAVDYINQNVAIISPILSVAAAFGGLVPAKLVLGFINDSGMTIAGSGNYVKYRGVYRKAQA
jgi:hypothetical protein